MVTGACSSKCAACWKDGAPGVDIKFVVDDGAPGEWLVSAGTARELSFRLVRILVVILTTGLKYICRCDHTDNVDPNCKLFGPCLCAPKERDKIPQVVPLEGEVWDVISSEGCKTALV